MQEMGLPAGKKGGILGLSKTFAVKRRKNDDFDMQKRIKWQKPALTR